MNSNSESSTTQCSKIQAQWPTLDSESPLIDQFSLFKLAREEKRPFDESLHTVLSESAQELATLLQEIKNRPDVALESVRQNQVSGELLMRAVQCAVKQHMLQTELSSLALTDELTGLYNRRGFLCLTERLLKLGHRSGGDLLLFFIDVDGLKRINDSFGHSEGDLALIRTAEVLTGTFRDSDVLARLGGDEFAALAIEASGHSEVTIMARLCESLATVNAQESLYPLSLSVGVVRVAHATSSLAELMLQADQAMYQAKSDKRKSMGQSEARDCREESTASHHPLCLIKGSRNSGLRVPGSLRPSVPECVPAASNSVTDDANAAAAVPKVHKQSAFPCEV